MPASLGRIGLNRTGNQAQTGRLPGPGSQLQTAAFLQIGGSADIGHDQAAGRCPQGVFHTGQAVTARGGFDPDQAGRIEKPVQPQRIETARMSQPALRGCDPEDRATHPCGLQGGKEDGAIAQNLVRASANQVHMGKLKIDA